MARSGMAMVSSPIVLVPAYGRSYSSVEKMLEAWREGKDFRIKGSGAYTSIRDITYLSNDASSVFLFDYVSGVNTDVTER